MSNPQCVAALRAVCEIYDRLPLSESAALAYFQATGISDEKLFVQVLFGWLKMQRQFPMPADVRQVASVRQAADKAASALS